MKYYVVSTNEIVFKQAGQVAAPSKEVVEQNIAAMFVDNKNSFVGLDCIGEAIDLANDYNADKADGIGFLVFEVEAPQKNTKDADIEYHIQQDKDATIASLLEGFNLELKTATFVRTHLGHLDPALKDCTIELNMKGTDISKNAADTVKTDEPGSENKNRKASSNDTSTNNQVVEEAKPITSPKRRTALGDVLRLGALATAAVAIVAGLTLPTGLLLAYAGIKLSFAAAFVASAMLSTVAITAAYTVMKGADYVSSKRNASKLAEETVKKNAMTEKEQPKEQSVKDEIVKQAKSVGSKKTVVGFSPDRTRAAARKDKPEEKPAAKSNKTLRS